MTPSRYTLYSVKFTSLIALISIFACQLKCDDECVDEVTNYTLETHSLHILFQEPKVCGQKS